MRHAPCQTTNHQGGLCFEKSSERREGKCFFQIYLGKKFPPKLSQQVFVSEKAYAPDSKSATPLAGQPFPNIIVSRICPVYQSPYPSGLCLGLSWRNPHLAPRRRWCSLLIKPTSFIDDYGVVSYGPSSLCSTSVPGNSLSEDMLLRVGAAFEAATKWHRIFEPGTRVGSSKTAAVALP